MAARACAEEKPKSEKKKKKKRRKSPEKPSALIARKVVGRTLQRRKRLFHPLKNQFFLENMGLATVFAIVLIVVRMKNQMTKWLLFSLFFFFFFFFFKRFLFQASGLLIACSGFYWYAQFSRNSLKLLYSSSGVFFLFLVFLPFPSQVFAGCFDWMHWPRLSYTCLSILHSICGY